MPSMVKMLSKAFHLSPRQERERGRLAAVRDMVMVESILMVVVVVLLFLLMFTLYFAPSLPPSLLQ